MKKLIDLISSRFCSVTAGDMVVTDFVGNEQSFCTGYNDSRYFEYIIGIMDCK